MSPYRENQNSGATTYRKPRPWWATRAMVAVSAPTVVGMAWAYLPHGGPAEGLMASVACLMVGALVQLAFIGDNKDHPERKDQLSS